MTTKRHKNSKKMQNIKTFKKKPQTQKITQKYNGILPPHLPHSKVSAPELNTVHTNQITANYTLY